jgi:hypothetical protein
MGPFFYFARAPSSNATLARIPSPRRHSLIYLPQDLHVGTALKTLRILAAAILLSVWALPAVHAADMGKIKPEICKGRATCRMSGLRTAGKSDAGDMLMMAELHFGLADKPKDGPEEGCKTEEEANDGGVEYWLIEGEKPPRLLLALCNDGYGAAGVGYDEVTIGENRLTHLQDGGSNDRWENIDVISLSPQRSLRTEFCGFRGTDPNYGVYGWIDVPKMAASSLAIDDSIQTNDGSTDNDDPCTALKKRIGKPVEHGYLGGMDVPFASLDQGSTEAVALPEKGMALGSCASVFRADGGSGYLVHGKNDPARIAELRFVADFHTLLVQIYDPRRDRGAPQSWVNVDHLEIWTLGEIGSTLHVDPAAARQIGVDLDGQVYAGLGNPELPTVERWEAVDEQNRPVIVLKLHWKGDEALYGGLGIAYSEAESGRQSRIYATTQIVKNRPLYLPSVTPVPVTCGAVDGRWDVTGNPGLLEPQGD